jgi:hypothetical protein
MNTNQENNNHTIFTPGFLRGVRKTLMKVKIRDFARYYNDRLIVIADWNRNAVPNHPGNAKSWLNSILTRLSLGIRVGYRNGKVSARDKLSLSTPIKMSDGGHRTRWDMEIVDKLLTTLNPEDRELVLNT